MPVLKPLTADEVPEGVIVNLESQRPLRAKGGKLDSVIDTTCRVCGSIRTVKVGMLRHDFKRRPNSAGYCRKCAPHKSTERPITAAEIPKHIKLDLKSQRAGLDQRGKQHLIVDAFCTTCGKKRSLSVTSIRYKLQRKGGWSGCCHHCHPRKRTDRPNGGISIRGGYRWIHFDMIESEILQIASKHGVNLKRRVRYFQEHRVVAFRKYGEIVFEKGIMVRHLDGNKLNNTPNNLAIGYNQDNVNDHMTSRREVALWRSIALTLFRMIVNK